MRLRALLASVMFAACTPLSFEFYTPDDRSSGAGSTLLCTPGSEQPCYHGPAGTVGQGICKAGTQICAPDGASWGACTGVVLPQPENCATPEDEDCDGLAPACKGTLLWAKRFGDGGEQVGHGIAVDASGNILVTGYFEGTLAFGAGPLIGAGGLDIFVAKLDPSGLPLWSRSFGDASTQLGRSIAVDAAGNVLIAGNFEGAVDFGSGTLTSGGGMDIFVAKFDASGVPLWSKSFGDALDQSAEGIAVDTAGNVLITGRFSGSMDLGTGTLTCGGASDIFVAKFDGGGAPVWSRRFGDAGSHEGQAIAVDGDGSVLMTGYFTDTVDFDGIQLVSAGGRDVFVAKLDASGSAMWVKGFGDGNAQVGQGIAVGPSHEVLVVGSFAGSIDFGGNPLVAAGQADTFVAKLDTHGNQVWSKGFGDGNGQLGQAVAVDAVGNTVLTGSFAGSVDFGGGPLVSAGMGDIYVTKRDAEHGEHQWTKRFGEAYDQSGVGVAVDAAGNVLVTGYIRGSVDFGSGFQLTSAGGADIFIAKISP